MRCAVMRCDANTDPPPYSVLCAVLCSQARGASLTSSLDFTSLPEDYAKDLNKSSKNFQPTAGGLGMSNLPPWVAYDRKARATRTALHPHCPRLALLLIRGWGTRMHAD
jgi:hypothetical protein